LHLASIFSGLPSIHKVLLKHIILFVADVANYNKVNKMGLLNLAICFGPNFLRPQEETIESSLQISKVNVCCQLILEHHKEIFKLI